MCMKECPVRWLCAHWHTSAPAKMAWCSGRALVTPAHHNQRTLLLACVLACGQRDQRGEVGVSVACHTWTCNCAGSALVFLLAHLAEMCVNVQNTALHLISLYICLYVFRSHLWVLKSRSYLGYFSRREKFPRTHLYTLKPTFMCIKVHLSIF